MAERRGALTRKTGSVSLVPGGRVPTEAGTMNDETRIGEVRPYPGLTRRDTDEERRRREERARRPTKPTDRKPGKRRPGGGLIDEFA